MNYLDRSKVTKYIALEPNTRMHDEIRKQAAEANFTEADGTLAILPFSAEEVPQIVAALGSPPMVDTLITILTLCSIPKPKDTITELVDILLKPGGQLLYYEHVLSPRSDVAWWQRFWTPLWRKVFDGCCLDRPTHLWVWDMGVWESKELWDKKDEEEEDLWWHQVGKFVKKSQPS